MNETRLSKITSMLCDVSEVCDDGNAKALSSELVLEKKEVKVSYLRFLWFVEIYAKG
jgi:hypothetical protein